MPDIFISHDESEGPRKDVKPVEKKEETKKLSKMNPTKKHQNYTPQVTNNVLASFMYHPKKVDFEAKENLEKVVLVLRQHPLTNLKWIVPFILLLIAPIVAGSFPIFDFMPKNFQFIAVMGWYMISFAFGFQGFLNWYFNVYIVTDERVVDIDFYNLIYKEVSDANIDKIQDVTYRMGGVFRTLFNFGDILIQTASERPNLEFTAVPRPDEVAKILQDLRIEEQQEAIEGRVR